MNLKQIKNTLTEKGFLLTLLFSVLSLYYFYGKLLNHPNHVFFGASADGLQGYYGALYHIKYDASYWRLDAMNYPYGDQVFFTACQPFLSDIIKFFNPYINLYDYTIGIINLVMLYSIVLSALCLYLIFKHLRVSYFYAAVAATAIAFLSPQVDRLGGHYSLTYQFAIPLFLLLLLKFYQFPTLKKSFFIFFLVFFMMGTHFYIYAMLAIIGLFYFGLLYLLKKNEFGNLKFTLKHFFIQIVLPFLTIQLITICIDHIKDRTKFPYGFFIYKGQLLGSLYRGGKFYNIVWDRLFKINPGEWEAQAYVGIVSAIFFIYLIVRFFKALFSRQYRNRNGFKATDDIVLNIFLLASIFSLILSFGFPFTIDGLKFLVDYAGPLKQLRALGRFSWLLYYVINIIAVYKIYTLTIEKKRKYGHLLMIVVLFFICFDAYDMSRGRQDWLNNPVPASLEDKENKLPENSWVNEINKDKYQAIITLPYIHTGSENVWLNCECDIMRDGYIASLKTGLPLVSVWLSRLSISQTYDNIRLITEPFQNQNILNDFKKDKSFLVIAREGILKENEKTFLRSCKKIKNNGEYNIYEIDVEALKYMGDMLYLSALRQVNETPAFPVDGFQSTDSLKTFVYDSYDGYDSLKKEAGKGYYEGIIKDYNVLYKGKLPNWEDQEYVLSFWMDNFTTDLYPRSTVELQFIDTTGKVYGSDYFSAHSGLSFLTEDRGLIERTFKLKSKDDQLKITLWCDQIFDKKKLVHLDDLLIRPVETHVYKKDQKRITIDNKIYLQK